MEALNQEELKIKDLKQEYAEEEDETQEVPGRNHIRMNPCVKQNILKKLESGVHGVKAYR